MKHWFTRCWTRLHDDTPEDWERGDVPGWVLITLMTAALVVAIWAVAQERLLDIFNQAMNSLTGIG